MRRPSAAARRSTVDARTRGAGQGQELDEQAADRARGPTTSAVSPGATRARSTARRQQASGSVNEAVSSVIAAGRRKVACSTLGAGTRTSSAKPPGSRLTRLKCAAHRVAAAPAVVAAAARHVMRRDHAIAGREAPHAGADLHDLAHHLVAEHGRLGRGRVDLQDVGAAEPAAAHAQQELAGARRGRRADSRSSMPPATQTAACHEVVRRAREPAADRDREAARRRTGSPAGEDVEAPRLDGPQQREVGAAHDLGGEEAARVGRGERGPARARSTRGRAPPRRSMSWTNPGV